MKHKFLLSVFCALLCSYGIAWAQERTITGKVTDSSDGSPLPGTTVIVKGTSTGTVVDSDGNFSISANSNDVLVFSFIGYTPLEVTVGASNIVNAVMEPDFETLQEVIVVGYGVQSKREITGSISKIDGDEIENMPVPSFEAALQGKAAGVQVIQGSGLAGSGSMIRVRGVASLSAGGDPLFVVDGIPITQDYFIAGDRNAFNNNPLATINPNDIESIEILKDASAAAIYGSRGANGVVLITTKRGKLGKPTFEFSTQFGISQPTRLLDLVNAQEYVQLYQEAWENDGNVGLAPLPKGITHEEAIANNTDWQDLTTQTGFKQEYNISMNQGTEKLRTYVGFSYSDNESFLAGNSYERISGRLNLDYNILPNLTANLSTMLSQGINNRVNAAWSGGLGAAMSDALVIYPVYNDDGSFFTDGNNPVRQQSLAELRTRENRSISTLALNFKPVENLTITGTGSLDYMDVADDQFIPSALAGDGVPNANAWPRWTTNYVIGLNAQYNLSLNSNNHFTFLLGSEYQRSVTKSSNLWARFIDGPFYEDPAIDPETNEGDPNSLVYELQPEQLYSFVSYFSRVNYAYDDKIFVKGSARVDGSSRFGRNNRYGFFPSLGLGYIISEEDFFPTGKTLNFVKLKASWGITGNADIPNYVRWGTFQRTSDGTPYNGEPILYPVRLENPDLKWEVQRTYDFGVEVGLFNDRIVLDLAYFDKRSTDVLIDRLVQPSTGFQRYLENIAEISNKGYEISITSRNLTGEFKWTTDVNMSHLENKVIDIGATPPDAIAGSGDTRVVEGMPVGVNYLNRFSRVDPTNGLPIFLDAEGNETYEFNLADRVAVGSVVPDWTGGITNTFNYKNFDLSVLFTFTLGGNIYDDAAKRQLGIVSDWNMRRDIVNRWQEPGDIAEFPRLTLDPTTYGGLPSFWNLNTTQFLYDASFGRLRNVSLGYNFSPDFASNLGLSSIRVFFNATNLVTFTKYPGADPEIVRDHTGRQGRNLSPNVTYLTPPQERAFTLGVNVKF